MNQDVINILLVDDEQRNLDALEAILHDPGYRLLRATDADTALRTLLKEGDIAAIVLDIKMPGVSGFELAQLIKGTKKFRQIPIVFLTAYMVDDQDVLQGYGAGAVDYLTKPVNPAVLRHKIGVFAELFRKTRALAELNDTLEERVAQRTAELERSEAALRKASQDKDAFLATLAHELRNPLAPLRTGLDLLRLVNDPSKAEKTLGAMNRQLDHMVRLIDDLLDISRITRGVLELRKEKAELRAVVEQALEAARPYLQQRKQRVEVKFDDPTLCADIDKTRVCQIIGNLLHNASKYTPPDGVIHVEVAREPAGAVIRVIDTGVGIPRDQLDRVFDMFARIERNMPSANGGLGIGLALSRRLAELHGGTVRAESAGEGRGATFIMTIPALVTTMIPVYTTQTARLPDGTPLRVVVIEDNADAADTLVMWLESQGHMVQLATNGPDGVELVREARPDIVLCDVGLPGMDGIEVCKQLRGLPPLRNVVMVALTGWGMESDRKRTGEAGFDHHLVKPVALDKLRDILSTVRAT